MIHFSPFFSGQFDNLNNPNKETRELRTGWQPWKCRKAIETPNLNICVWLDCLRFSQNSSSMSNNLFSETKRKFKKRNGCHKTVPLGELKKTLTNSSRFSFFLFLRVQTKRRNWGNRWILPERGESLKGEKGGRKERVLWGIWEIVGNSKGEE